MMKLNFVNSTSVHPEFNRIAINSRMPFPFVAVLGFLLFISSGQFSIAQLYQQQYNTPLANTSNASITNGTYCGSSPTSAQFNFIGSNGAGCSFEVPAVTQKLTFVRTANAGIFTRSTDFSPVPTAAFYKFDLTVSGNSVAQTNAAMFQMGFGFGTTYAPDNSTQSHANLGVNLSSTDGEFSLRNASNTTSTANFSGTQTICWVINNTGAAISYVAPDGTIQSVDDDKEDVWVGNTLAFDEAAAFDPARSLRNIKFVFNAGSAKIEIDNFTVAPVTSAPVASNQVICAGTSPTVASLVATGSNLKWYNTATGGTPLLSTDAVSNGTYYVSQTIAGFESVRTAVTVTVSSIGISNNTISSDQTICTGNIPSAIIGTTPNITNGSGLFSYSWEVSSTSAGSGFSTIGGQTGIDYAPSAPLASNRWYRRIVTSDGCAQYSNVIQISVQPTINNNITSNQNICEGVIPAALSGTPTGGSGTYSYTWESSVTDGTSGFSAISGANSLSYTPSPLSQTTWFRRTVSSGACPDVTSASIQITINPAIIGNSIASDQTICTGSIPAIITGSVPTGGNGTYAYFWETSTTSPGVSGYSSASGTGKDFTPSVALTTNRWYRRRVISGVCTTFSAPVMITVSPLIGGNTISAAQTICSLNAAAPLTGSVPTGGISPYSYSWESSTTSGSAGFSLVSGENGQGISPGILGQTTWFRRIVSAGPCPSITSSAVAITVNLPISGNDVTGNQTICANTTSATLIGSIPTGGNGTSYTYLWEVATSASGAFSSASVTTANYSPGTLTTSRWYRRRVTSGLCAVSYSDTVLVAVTPGIGTNTISASQTICSGSTPSFTGSAATGGNGVYTYSWESSTTSASAGFSPVSGADAQNFTSGPLTANTWIRRRIDSDVCFSLSSAVAITINQPVLNNDIFSPQSICGNTAPDTLKGTVPTGGTGTLSYLWEVATTSSGPFSSASASTAFYKPPVLTSSRWYRRRVTAGVCPANFSDTIEITVTPAIATNTISASQTICSGFAPASFTGSLPTGGTGVYTYEWESSTTSATLGFSPIAASNVQSYASGALTVNTWFRRKVYSGPFCVATSGAVAITINQPTANNDISAPQTICANTVPATLTGSLPTGGTGTYSYLWEASTSASGTFNSQGVSTINFSPAALTSSRWYRRRLISGACPANYSDTIAVLVTPAITANTISSSQNVCYTSTPNPLTGSIPAGAAGGFTYEWEVSTTSASAGFSLISGETGQGLILSPVGDTTWYRRIVYSDVCTNRSVAVQISPSPDPTLNVGPAMADIVQGGISAALGGSFGGAATGAVWSAAEGTFASNSGSTPGTATYTASLNSAPAITLTLTSTGSTCPAISVTKTIYVVPDPNGITGVINQYAEVVAPATLSTGALKCTLATGQASLFAKNDRALIVQMKGASISLPGSPTDVTYGYITAMGSSGNNEFLTIDSVDGDVVFFQRCIKKNYTISGSVQLVRVPQYTGNYNVKSSSAVSAIRVTRKGMGYPPNTTITSGFTITPVQGGAGLTLQAKSDALGQINEIEILDGGAGYLKPPIITLPDPTVPPFDLPAYKAKALAVMGLTGKQWNGKTGGILCFEVDGNVVLNDSIHMTGMGFAGGMIGDKGDVTPTCGASAEFALNFSSYMRAGQKGEGITAIPVSAMRGKGRYATGGGGGVEPEGGGGGGANWQDGGRGGSSSYIVITNSACSTTVTPCDQDVLRGGLGGGTNPTTPIGFKNVLRSNSYYYQPALSRFFLGGGGGGGHAFNDLPGMQLGGAGGFGGGIVILKSDNLTSNNLEILANGEKGENTDGDGAGGGGAGGAVLLLVNNFVDAVNARVNGGNGGSSNPTICELSVDENAYPSRKRYSGAGGGGGGGVVWFTASDEDISLLAENCNLGQSSQGTNGDGFNNTAQKGGSAISQSDLVAIENIPLTGSVFTVGGSGATFPNLQKAAEFLSFKGTDAPVVTLQVTNNTSNAANLLWYKAAATFTRIFTGGCTYGDATLVIQPKAGVNTVNLQNEMDDLTYITLDGVPSVTIKNMLISGSYDNINTSILVKGGSKLFLENVNVTAEIKSDSTGNNEMYLKNTTHTGGIEVGNNQKLTMEGTITMNGIASAAPSLKFGSNSEFDLPAGTTLNLNGASWINNGASLLNIDPASTLNFGGTFTNQTIGGTTPTTFQKLNILGTGTITTTSNNTVFEWNQTGSATVSTSNKILTISGKVKTSAGSFISTGAGRVSLAGSAVVDVEGRFGNLEVNSANHAKLTGNVTVDNTLILTNGKLNPSGFSLSIENTAGSSVVNSPTSWVAGPLKRKVAAGNSYFFPVGVNSLEKSLVNISSVSGLQYLTCKFMANDPMTHPLPSIVNPYQDGPAYFSALSPEGYWNITPDAGTATYDMWLFPSFYGMFPQYSIYKRPTASNEWSIFGDLSNPENTQSYVQADGSVRRTGLIGFSDFALAGGEDPLPLNFLDFRVSQRRGIGKLNWKMADCLKEGKFTIYRGTSTSNMEKVGTLNVNEAECTQDFSAEDILPGNAHTFYYQISASARNEKTEVSPVRIVKIAEASAERPFLAVIQNDPSRFQLMNDNIEETGINIVSVDGKTIASNLKAENKILDLRSIPKGVYLVEMVNSGWSVRQRVVVGL